MSTKRKGHRNGRNIGGSHTTVTDFTGKIVDLLRKMDLVRRIILGYISSTARGSHSNRVEFVDDLKSPGAVRVKVIGNGCVQWLIIILPSDSEEKNKKMAKLAEKLRIAGVEVSGAP